MQASWRKAFGFAAANTIGRMHLRRSAPRALLLAFLLVSAACGGGGSGAKAHPKRSAESSLLAPYAYDRRAPLRFRDHGILNKRYPVKVHAISYASPKGGRVRGYVLVPPGNGRLPAVIYMHGSGEDGLAWVPQAAWAAGRRAVGMTIDSPYARLGRSGSPEGLAGARRDRDLSVQNVVELRRAVDLLRSHPRVDPNRIGYVGFSAGARTGAVLAGVEHRIKAYVFLSGGATPVGAYTGRLPSRLRRQVAALLSTSDPLRYVRHADGASLLFLNGRRDELVPQDALRRLARAAPQPKEVRWYDTGHAPTAQVYRDHLRWLSRVLGIRGPPVPGALTGPG